MTKKPTPPVSPVSSEEENKMGKNKSIPLPKCSEEDFKKHIKSFKPRYSYGDWLKIGMIC